MFTGTVSEKKCFLCSSMDSLEVKFKDKSFAGIVCWKHLKELVTRDEASSDSRTSKPVAQPKPE